nr:ABC transporter permease [Kibdelosporangium sp. MJ126-NF4]CEL12838.1 putative integral membrane protein [Kibdelosporangium sp. MJ126-NF4]CTQ98524.1 putative integral membrane protein [Kibdelosporangium sp. MJ126-NF4]
MMDTYLAEWVKLRSVRSTYYIVGVAVLLLVVGGIFVQLGVSGWDNLAPDRRANFQAAPFEELIAPVLQLCLAVLAILTITAEYATGMIRTSLTAVPQRSRMLLAKLPVVALVTFVVGQVVEFGMFFIGRLIIGDRPIPGNTDAVSAKIPYLFGLGLLVMVVGLVGLGLGAAIRSTAGAIVSVAVLVFVLPGLAGLLPSPWNDRVAAVLLPNLASQLAGTDPAAVLSPLGALAVMAAYLITALGAGLLMITRRDS